MSKPKRAAPQTARRATAAAVCTGISLILGVVAIACWEPVFRFLRSEWRNEDESRELAQEFSARLLARGGLDGADPLVHSL